MTISVIIPTFNEERIIADTLSSAASLDFDELIVVDGESTDQTSTLVQSYKARSNASNVFLLTGLRGRARQLNAGAESSRGDILLFLHADTQLPLTAKRQILSAFNHADIVGGRFNIRFDRPSVLGNIVSFMMNWRSRWTGIATGDQAIFVRRHAFRQLGGFADIPLMEDIDFSRRLKKLGRLAMLSDQVVTSFRRWEHRGPVKTIVLMWGLRLLFWLGVSPHRLAHFYAQVR